jgi:hypothetical protein
MTVSRPSWRDHRGAQLAAMVPRADWRHPEGPGSDADAEAFARWAGGSLPSEVQVALEQVDLERH